MHNWNKLAKPMCATPNRPLWKINGHAVQFYHNEENRITTATIHGCSSDVFNGAMKLCGFNLRDCWELPSSFRRISMPNTIKAIAKCHPDDIYNFEEGKKMAYKKLRKKYWGKYAKRMKALTGILVHAASLCLSDSDNASTRADQIVM